MKKILYRPLLFAFTMLLTLIIILQVSYGYFDALHASRSSTINIGDWLNNKPSSENVEEYVKEIKIPDDEVLADYVLEVIGDYVDGQFVIDETFEDYTMAEIIEIVDLINEFTDSFLDYDDGNAVFPNVKVEPIPMNNIQSFSPGDVQYIKKVIQTAQFGNTPYYTPITFQLVLSAPDGIDISDFSIELLIDATPFAIQNPFSYDFKLNDPHRNHYSTILQQGVQSSASSNLPLMVNASYVNRVYSVVQSKFLRFKHEYQAPEISGEWKRFPVGPNLYFNQPATGGTWSGSRQQFQTENVPEKVAGMTLSGRNDGNMVEILFALNTRVPRNSSSLPIIPVTIVISRAKEVDINGNFLPIQRTDTITPEIKFRVVKDSVYQN